MPTDRELIEIEIRNFIAAYNAADLAGIMRCYDEDLIKMRHGAPSEKKSETEVRIGKVLRDFTGQLEVVNDEIVVCGEMAFVRGGLSILLTPRASGEPMKIERRFIEIWRKREGKWRVSRTMDNIA